VYRKNCAEQYCPLRQFSCLARCGGDGEECLSFSFFGIAPIRYVDAPPSCGTILQPLVSVRPEEEIAHLPFAAEGELADGKDQLAGGLDGLEMLGQHAAYPGIVDPALQHDYGILPQQFLGVRPVLILQIVDAEQTAAMDLLGRVQVKCQLAGAGIGAVADGQVKDTGAWGRLRIED